MVGMLDIGVGLLGSVASGALLWFFAFKCRTAASTDPWSREWVATTLSLVLVGMIVLFAAWVIKGVHSIVEEPILGVAAGFLVTIVAIMAPVRLLGRLPIPVDRPPSVSPPEAGEAGRMKAAGPALSDAKRDLALAEQDT